MRTTYRVLAYLVAAEVAVQAMAVVWAMAGLGHWIDSGGVADKALIESGSMPFPEVLGFIVHGINGSFVIPALSLALLVVSFFVRARGAVRWAAIVFALVVVQTQLGFLGHEVPAIGALHGLNALALFTVALVTARRRLVAKTPPEEAPPVETERTATAL